MSYRKKVEEKMIKPAEILSLFKMNPKKSLNYRQVSSIFNVKDDSDRKKIAKNGKAKYMKYFNSTIVADYIINNTFNFKYNKNKFMWSNK